jgi:polyhydroxyalkanoate synthesis regulator phasin
MAEPKDMIMPMLREMRAETQKNFVDVKQKLDKHEVRLDRIEERQKSFSHALAGDSLMSKMLVGDWEERIEALEKKVKKLEAAK